MNKVFFGLISILCFTGCFPFDEGEEAGIIGRYYVRGDSRLLNVHIGYEDGQYGGSGLISEPITEIGHNKDFIIAKRGTDNAAFYILKVVKTVFTATQRRP